MLSLVASTDWITAGMRRGPLPHPRQLSELGAVLCCYRRRWGSELMAWDRAVRVEVRSGDAQRTPECMMFFDRSDHCCWRLYLLPDTDFLAWDALASELPAASGPGNGWARWWGRLCGAWHGGGWSNCILRLHDHSALGGNRALAASLTRISMLGMKSAQRILRSERLGAMGTGTDEAAWKLTTGQV